MDKVLRVSIEAKAVSSSASRLIMYPIDGCVHQFAKSKGAHATMSDDRYIFIELIGFDNSINRVRNPLLSMDCRFPSSYRGIRRGEKSIGRSLEFLGRKVARR